MSAAVLDQPTLLDALDDRRDMKEVNGMRGHAEDVPDLTLWLWEHEGQWVTITSLGRCADECQVDEGVEHCHSGVLSWDWPQDLWWGVTSGDGVHFWFAMTFNTKRKLAGMTATNHEVLSISA